jgi:hypothetical protein
MVALSLLLVYLLYEVWPTATTDASGEIPESRITLFGDLIELTVSAEVRLILMVMVVGALGGNVHGLRSFANFAGVGRLTRSWVWWYLYRPFIGLPMALIFYFAVRGGLLSIGAETGDINRFGIAAVAALVGMFSDQAAMFLRRLFATMFEAGKTELAPYNVPEHRLTNPVLEIVAIDPETVSTGADVTLTVRGNNFLPESRVRFNGEDRPTTFVSATELTVRISASDLSSPGQAQVTVFNPLPGGTSKAAILRIA